MLFLNCNYFSQTIDKVALIESLKVLNQRDQMYRLFLTYHTFNKDTFYSITSLSDAEHNNYIEKIQKNFDRIEFKLYYDSISTLQKKLDTLNKNDLIKIIKDYGFKRPNELIGLYPLIIHQTSYYYFLDNFQELLYSELIHRRIKPKEFAIFIDSWYSYFYKLRLYGELHNNNNLIYNLITTNEIRNQIGLKKLKKSIFR